MTTARCSARHTTAPRGIVKRAGTVRKSMKLYTFAPISAREYPTIALLDNPFIWGGVQFCVNVSEKPYPVDIARALAERGID